MSWPGLDPGVAVGASVDDVEALVDRFEIFEALHHGQTICNPMTSDELDRVITALDLRAGSRMLDIACGSGELMFRAGERYRVDATGLDLSPWMLNAAATRAGGRKLLAESSLQWVLCNAKEWPVETRFDVVTCLGADWIWHGTAGTVAAMAERVTCGGTVAIGSPRLHFEANPTAASAQFGVLDTIDDIAGMLDENDFDIVERVDPDDAGWDSYMERCVANAKEWQTVHPGERADTWLAEAHEWAEIRERDRSVIGWSVWVARSRS